MTGEATDRALIVEAPLIQIEHHLNHTPCSQLRGLVVLIETVRHVAIIASHAERAGDKSHRGFQLRRREAFEDLNVLESLLGSLLLCE
jgi:hypothetical protein